MHSSDPANRVLLGADALPLAAAPEPVERLVPDVHQRDAVHLGAGAQGLALGRAVHPHHLERDVQVPDFSEISLVHVLVGFVAFIRAQQIMRWVRNDGSGPSDATTHLLRQWVGKRDELRRRIEAVSRRWLFGFLNARDQSNQRKIGRRAVVHVCLTVRRAVITH